MGAQENKQATEAAYDAFARGDAEAAMANMDDSIVWKSAGDNALTGIYNGKEEVAGLWAQLAGKEFRTEPKEFVADGDTVVVLATVTLEGTSTEEASILRFGADGKLVSFETLGDPTNANRVFAK